MLLKIKQNITKVLSNIHFEQENNTQEENNEETKREATTNIKSFKVPRNSPCTCGSGKKYKHCCGKI